MESFLITNKDWSQSDWLKFLERSSQKLPYKFLNDPVLKAGKPEVIISSGSIGGVELLLQDTGLKVFSTILPSRKDLRFIRQLLETAVKNKCVCADAKGEKVLSTILTDDKIQKWFESSMSEACNKDSVVIHSNGRKADIAQFLKVDLPVLELERKLIDSLHALYTAGKPDIYPIDEVESVIWDGTPVWLGSTVKQILFSQKVFKGRLCGEISVVDFVKAVPDRLWDTGFGVLLKDKSSFSASDLDVISVHMGEHFATKKVKKSFGKLEIEAGKLREISYTMAKCIFTNKPLAPVTESYQEEGISKEQLEVTALAVSGMLEIAAVNKGLAIEEMVRKLIEKNRLTKNAAASVANGFVQAATEVKLPKKGLRWGRFTLLALVLGLVIWYFFLK